MGLSLSQLKINGKALIIATYGLFLCLTAPIAQAQTALQIYNKETPHYPEQHMQGFADKAKDYAETPLNDENLAFSVKLSPKWQPAKSFGFSLSDSVMSEIARFDGNIVFNQSRSYLTVEAQKLAHKTTIKQWFADYAWQNGYSVQGAGERADGAIEAVYVDLVDGETYIVRSLAFINAGTIIQVKYFLPQIRWQQERGIQDQVIKSFALKNTDKTIKVETRGFDYLDIASFQYPTNWWLYPPKNFSRGQMIAQILKFRRYHDPALRRDQQEVVIIGHINIHALSANLGKSSDELMVMHLEHLTNLGIVIQEPRENQNALNILLPQNFAKQRIKHYTALDGRHDGRQSHVILVSTAYEGYNYVFSLVSPTRELDALQWERNIAAFKAVAQGIGPVEP